MLIDLAARVITMKTFVIESSVMGAIDVDWDDMHRKMALMRQDTMVLQVAIV